MAWFDAHLGAVQAISAGVQAVTTVVLVCVTIRYTRHTRASADAARASVAEMQQQRRDNVRPALVLSDARVRSEGDVDLRAYIFSANVFNVGAFPAFDVRLSVDVTEPTNHDDIAYLRQNDSPLPVISVATEGRIPARTLQGDYVFTVS